MRTPLNHSPVLLPHGNALRALLAFVLQCSFALSVEAIVLLPVIPQTDNFDPFRTKDADVEDQDAIRDPGFHEIEVEFDLVGGGSRTIPQSIKGSGGGGHSR